MALSGTPLEILRTVSGEKNLTDSALHQWQRNFNAFNAVRRNAFYTELIAKVSNLPTAWKPFRRYVEDFAEVRQGDGSQIYLLTGVNPTPGTLYSPEYNSEQAANFLFGNHKPDLRQSAIAQVRNWQDVVTIKEHEIASANFEGALDLAGRMTDNLRNSDFLSEWNVTLAMLFDAIRSGIAKEVTTPAPTDDQSSRDFSAFIGALADWMDKPSSLYNPERMTQAFDTADLIILTRSTTWQTISKNQYSASYNPEYMRGLTDKQYVTIPDEYWPSDLDDVTAVVLSKQGANASVVIVDNYTTEAASVNAPYQSINQARVHGSVFGINPMGAMVVVKSGTQQAVAGSNPVPTEVVLELLLNGAPVTEVVRGYTYKINAYAKDVHGFTAGRTDVLLDGDNSPTKHTFIQVDDLDFYVGLDEESTTLGLTAVAVLNGAVIKHTDYPVVGTKVPLVPPFEPVEFDYDDNGEFDVTLTPSQVATFSGNTANPGDSDEAYTLSYTGKVGGVVVTKTDFVQPVTLTTAGDTITVLAEANPTYELHGTTSRTLNYS